MNKIFRSQSLLRALAILALHQDEEYGVEDLARLIGATRPSVLVSLQALQSDGLVDYRSVGKKKLYRVVTDHPLYPEIASIAIKTFGGQEVILRALRSDPHVCFAAIFGSFAAGTPTPRSDIDVLVLIDDDDADETDYRVATALALAGDRIGRVIHPNLVRRSQAADKGVIREILAGPLIVLKGLPADA